MTFGTILASGQAVMAAAAAGTKGSIAVALASLAAADEVIVTVSGTSLQDIDTITKKDNTFQVVKEAGVGFTIYGDEKQSPEILLDYVVITASTTVTMDVPIIATDSQDGGASNGPLIKKELQASEAYTGTTAGLMVKNYGTALATVPSGEFTGLYVNVKGLHVSPGNNASLISAHVHGSNTTVIHAGVWLYGDMTNGLKMSGSTLTSAIDISEATAVTNVFNLPAAGTAPVTANALVPSAAPDASTVGADACLTVSVNGTPYYIALYDTLHA